MIVNERGESENCYELGKQTKRANNRNRKRIVPTKSVKVLNSFFNATKWCCIE